MPSNPDKQRQIESVAFAILEETRSAALVAYRFMGPALYAMPFVSVPLKHAVLATDGRKCGFNAQKVIRSFRDNPNELVKSYLHLIFHCVYRHPFDARHPRRNWWDISCDIAFGATVHDLASRRFSCDGDDERAEALAELRTYSAALTAEKLYHAIALTKNGAAVSEGALPNELVNRLEALFVADEHGYWPRGTLKFKEAMRRKPKHVASDFLPADDAKSDEEHTGNAKEGPLESLSSPTSRNSSPKPDDADASAAGAEDGSSAFGEWPDDFDDQSSDTDFDFSLWDKIAKQVEADLRERQEKTGYEVGTFTVSLNLAGQKRFDYHQFLRRFASLSEEVKTSPDEFDYIYYNHGLTLYSNMPLIEPLEYQERSRVRGFVVAVDTSASCSGDLVRRFVQRTYDILKSADGFGDDVNVHIVQCDDEIRDVLKVKSVEDLDAYFKNFKMSGLGNTDFRPVFEYVDDAIASQEFKNLKGIIYLTDGEGEYPLSRPSYDAVFLFVEPNPAFLTRVPPWAMKAVMDGNQIVEL